MDERLSRTATAVREADADWVILTSPETVCYASGHVVPIETGPSPFNGGPTTAFVSRDGACGVVCTNIEQGAAALSWVETEIYTSYQYEQSLDLQDEYVRAVRDLAARLGVRGRIATEAGMSAALALSALNAAAHADITPRLNQQRATKTAAELAALGHSGQAAAIGQRRFYDVARAGRTELEAFADIRCAMESFAGERCAIAGDFLSGRERTAARGGWPIARMMQAGDAVISDLAPRVDGYWGDSCASGMIGEPTEAYLRHFEAARSALSLAVSIIRPGLSISALDTQLRAEVGRFGYAFPHHAGHGIGTGVHEWPRIVPYEHTLLREGMVLMVEPGAYTDEVGGVRLEWMFEVTATGCKVLTEFEPVPRLG